jgi:hypothetical protein
MQHQSAGQQGVNTEHGAFIVFGALAMSALLAITALGLDLYFIAVARFQQSATSESIALGTIKTFMEHPDGSQIAEGSARYDFAIQRGEILGFRNLLGGSDQQVYPGDLVTNPSEIGSVTFGWVDPDLYNNNSQVTFVEVAPQDAATANTVRVNLRLRDHNVSPFILPLGKILAGEGAVSFQSTTCAFFAEPGTYKLLSPEICGS